MSASPVAAAVPIEPSSDESTGGSFVHDPGPPQASNEPGWTGNDVPAGTNAESRREAKRDAVPGNGTSSGDAPKSETADLEFAGRDKRQANGGGNPGTQEVHGYTWTFPAMGTLVSFKTFHHDPKQVESAFREAEKLVRELESILTDYDRESETSRLTTSAIGCPVQVSQPLWEVLVLADRWNRLTGGAVDASFGRLTKLWRKYRRADRRPDDAQVQAALENCGWQYVQLHPDCRSVELELPVEFDFGAIAKGYVADRAFALLVARGLKSSMVNISGNMRLGDPPPQRTGWRIALASLERDGPPLGTLQLANCAIATSGDLWQFMVIEGVRRSHILDPRTGWGVIGPCSATAIAKRASDADALATAGCILDPVKAIALANSVGARLLIARRCENGDVQIERTDDFVFAQ